MDKAKLLSTTGSITGNEIRAMVGMERVEGLDTIIKIRGTVNEEEA